MAISKPLTRYNPTRVPVSASKALRAWLDNELNLVSYALNGVTDYIQTELERPRMMMWGTADTIPLTLVPVKIVNYEFTENRGVSETPDQVNGTMIVPETGVYTGLAYVFGTHINALPQSDEILLYVDIDGVLIPISTFDVESKKTDDRVLNAVITSNRVKGEVLSLWIAATADIGSLVINRTSFQLVKLRDR